MVLIWFPSYRLSESFSLTPELQWLEFHTRCFTHSRWRRGSCQNVLVFTVSTLHWLVAYLFNPRCQRLGKWIRFAGLFPFCFCSSGSPMPFHLDGLRSLSLVTHPRATGILLVPSAWSSWPPPQSSWVPDFASFTVRCPSLCCLHSETETDPRRSVIHIDPLRSQTEPQSLVSFRRPLKILPAYCFFTEDPLVMWEFGEMSPLGWSGPFSSFSSLSATFSLLVQLVKDSDFSKYSWLSWQYFKTRKTLWKLVLKMLFSRNHFFVHVWSCSEFKW